jgi:hypothetical protein
MKFHSLFFIMCNSHFLCVILSDLGCKRRRESKKLVGAEGNPAEKVGTHESTFALEYLCP